jgi:hypothetical protein
LTEQAELGIIAGNPTRKDDTSPGDPDFSSPTTREGVPTLGWSLYSTIKHHLRTAGYQGQLFSDSFIAAVYDHTKGVARKINNLCRNALLLGATENKQILDETDLKRVLLDLEGQIG